MFPEVFTGKLGKYKFGKVALTLKPDVTPIYLKHRTVPFAYRAQIEEQLERMVREDVIEPVENSEWATPVVPVVRQDKAI